MVAKLPTAWGELVRLAELKMEFVQRPLRFFLETGDELEEDGLDLVRANDVVYVSDGQGWEPPGESTTTDPTSDSERDVNMIASFLGGHAEATAKARRQRTLAVSI